MEIAARVSTKGQLTVPKPVCNTAGLNEGDDVIFRVEWDRALLVRTAELLSLARSITVPAAKRDIAWDDVVARTRSERASAHR